MAKLVRLKPHDPKKGHVIRRYTAFSIRFEEARGWYKVADEVAAYLGTVRPSLSVSPHSPGIFAHRPSGPYCHPW